MGIQNIKEIQKFLITARSHTYAADTGKVNPLIPGTTQLEYREGDWFYRDIYDGELRFQGREVIYHQDRPLWGMVYEGGMEMLPQGVGSEDVYNFLRKSLLKHVGAARIAGEVHHKEGEFRYEGKTNAQEDVIGKFWGEEKISYHGEVVYQLAYGGGWLR